MIDNKTNTADFDSLGAFMTWLDTVPADSGAGSSSRQGGGGNWDFGCGWQGAVDHGNGKAWKLGADAMVKGSAQAAGLRKPAAVPVIGYDVAGFLPDVPGYLAGVPDHMLSVTDVAEAQGQKEIVTICLSGFSASCSDAAMLNRGVAFMSLVDALEADGARCEVYFSSSIVGSRRGGSGSAHLKVCIKKAADHWSPNTAAFALAHPAMFRRLWFAAMERFASVNRYTNGGYGPCELVDAAQYTFSVPYQVGDGPYRSLAGALREVQGMARKAGHDVELIKE